MEPIISTVLTLLIVENMRYKQTRRGEMFHILECVAVLRPAVGQLIWFHNQKYPGVYVGSESHNKI